MDWRLTQIERRSNVEIYPSSPMQAEDVLELFEREGGLMWTAHPRVKGSTGFPDGYQDQAFFESDRFLGGAWKAMPADYSRDTLGWRVLDLGADMANWGNQKYVLGEVDIFLIAPVRHSPRVRNAYPP